MANRFSLSLLISGLILVNEIDCRVRFITETPSLDLQLDTKPRLPDQSATSETFSPDQSAHSTSRPTTSRSLPSETKTFSSETKTFSPRPGDQTLENMELRAQVSRLKVELRDKRKTIRLLNQRLSHTTHCSPGQLQCRGYDNDGSDTCVPHFKLCDGRPDCGDGTDEVNCDACVDSFLCGKDRKCIQTTMVCDDHPACSDGADEAYCGKDDELASFNEDDSGSGVDETSPLDTIPDLNNYLDHPGNGPEQKQIPDPYLKSYEYLIIGVVSGVAAVTLTGLVVCCVLTRVRRSREAT